MILYGAEQLIENVCDISGLSERILVCDTTLSTFLFYFSDPDLIVSNAKSTQTVTV